MASAARPLIVVTSGPRNARTDPDTGLRFYTWEGKEYVSVTTTRNLAGMPHPLANWRTNQVIGRAMTEYETLGRMLGESPPKAVEQWLRKAANIKRDAAGDIGKRVHDAAQKGLSLSKAAPDIAPYLRWYYQWLDDSKFQSELKERQVWNLTVGYAGTFDDLGIIPKTGLRWMIDLKTGGGTYPEHAMQLEAYSRTEFVGEDDVRDDIATKLLHKVDRRAILHLSPTGYRFQVINEAKRERSWIAFRGLLVFAKFIHENPSIDSLISQTVNSKPA